ncbi:zinc finger protein 79-like [Lutzomyia longipalpis]|nr:zinc finger protein 79-like [Lutzomyia longipalpis]
MNSFSGYSRKICRTCLEENGKFRSIFTKSNRLGISAEEMLQSFSNVKVIKDDKLPGFICYNCLHRLENAYKFKIVCESSDYYLRECLLRNIDISSRSGKVRKKTPDDNVNNDQKIGQEKVYKSAEPKVPPTKRDSYSIASLVPEFDESSRKDGEKGKKRKVKEPQKCFKCGKTFQYRGYLTTHLRTHTGVKPFECPVCKKKFAQAGNVHLHLRTHSRERRYQCEICSKMFTTSSNLYAHHRTHSIERNFICSICSKAFKTSGELASHAGTHSGLKSHVCKVCGKAFYKTSYLNLHIRTVHVGEKRHRCTDCGKEFSSRSNLTCHFRIHTGEKPFACKFCGDKFNQSSALMRHARQHTGGKKISPKDAAAKSEQSQNVRKVGNFSESEEIPQNPMAVPAVTYSSYYLKFHDPQEAPPGIIVCDQPPPESSYDFTKPPTIDYIKTYSTYPFNSLTH